MISAQTIINRHKKDPTRLIDVLRDVQAERGCIDRESRAEIARVLGLSEVEVEGVVSFHHFFSRTPVGRYAVYLNNSITSQMKGRASVARAFEKESGCPFGSVSPDGLIGLHDTSCLGMSDQEPSAIIRGTLFHHYRVDANDQITMDNLIVSTTNNNEPMNRAVHWVAQNVLSEKPQITRRAC